MSIEPEQALELLILNTEEPFVMVDTDLNIITFNRQLEKQYFSYFGVQIIRGNCILNYAQRSNINQLKEIYEQVLSGKPFQAEISVALPDKPAVTFAVKYKTAYNAKGEVVGVIVSSTDISEIKRSQQLVLASDNRFRSLINNANDIISLTDKEGLLLYVSPALERVTGFSPGEMIGRPISALIHPQALDESKITLKEALQKPGVSILSLTRFLHKNGNYVWVEGTVTNLLEDKYVEAIVSNYHDITHSKEAEEKLRQNQAELNAILNNEPECVKLVDLEGQLLEMNPAGLKMLGVDELHQLKGHNVAGLIHEDDRDIYQATHDKSSKGETATGSFRVFNLRREIIWMETHSVPLRNDTGDIYAVLSVTRDITERKKAQELLAISENRFRSLVENSGDAVAIVGADGKPLFVSSSITKVLGYTEEEAMQLDMFKAVHPDDLESIQRVMAETIANPGVSMPGHTGRMRHKDGSWHWYESVVTNMLHEPAINGIVNNFRDITEKVALEKQKEFDHSNLDALINNTRDLMWSISTDGKLITSNNAFDEAVKYLSGHEVVKGGDAPVAGFSKENVDRWDKLYRRAFAGEIFTIVEYLESPVEHWSEISFYPISQGNDIIGIACYSRNITERKLFERKLEKNTSELLEIKNVLERSEKSLKEAQELAQLGSWETDLPSGTTIWSDEMYKILGIKKGDHIPSPDTYFSLIHPEDQAQVREITHDAIKRLVPYSCDFRTVGSDGKTKYFQSTSRFIFNKQGKALRMQGTLHDITDRKKSDKRLLHTQVRLKQAQALAHIGNWETNLTTGVSIWSDEAFHIYGLEPAKHGPSFEQWKKLIHPEDLPEFELEMQRVHQILTDLSHAHRIVRKDGTVRHVVSESRFEFNSSGKPRGLYGVVYDITERVKAEEDLFQSHKLLQKLTDKVPVTVYEFKMDASGKASFPFISRAISEILPDFDAELLNDDAMPLIQKVCPDDLPGFIASIEKSRVELSPWEQEFRTTDTSGELVWMRGASRPEKKDNGDVIWYGYLQNITEKKLADEEIRIAKERYDIVAKATNDAVWDWNILTNELHWGEGFKNMFGYELHTINFTLDYWKNHIHPEDTKRVLDSIDSTLSSDSATQWQQEYRFLKADGVYADVFDRGYLIRNKNGIPERMLGAAQDITQRRISDENIRVAKERYDFVAKATNDAIYDWDLIADKVVRTGDGLLTLFGYTLEEAAENDFWVKRIHPDDIELSYEKLKFMLLDPEIYICNQEYRFRTVDNSYAYVYDKGIILRDMNGKAIRMIGATQDITHRKESELLLKSLNQNLEKRALELATSNTELEQFAYIASHDLQEPLRMVTSFLTQLENKYKDQLDERAQKYIHFATDGAIRMRRIILDLLEYSRAGRQNNDAELVDSNDLLFEAVQLNQAVIDEKKALIEWKDLPVIKGSRSMLQQVFQNLLANALKYQSDGVVPRIEINGSETASHWQFAFSDNGIGIEARYFDKIFIVFQRLHNTNEYSGTGIGLAICKKIIQNHHGRIWVESDYGKGSTFYFSISKHTEAE